MGTFIFDSSEGKRLLRNLYAFSRAQYSKLYRSEVNDKGKSFKDYVIDAVEKYLRNPDKYDAVKAPLEYYLKYHLIWQALHNDLPIHLKKEYALQRQLTTEQAEMIHRTPNPEIIFDPDEVEVVVATLSDHDRKLLFAEIEKGIEGDQVVEQIYLAVAHEKYNLSDREEICQDFSIIKNDFDNGRRRFITVLKRVFKKLQLTL